MSFNSTALGMGYALESRGLSYPSVPPPSLSSSFGSPTVPLLHISNGNGRDVLLSPIEPLSRRNSNAGINAGSNIGGSGIARRGSLDRRVMESGSLRGGSGSGSVGGRSRRGSFDHGVPIGGRIAESGTLLGRSRGGSHVSGSSGGSGQLPETVDEVEDSFSPLPIAMEFGEVSNNSSSFGSGTAGMLDTGSDLDIPSTKSR